MKVSDFFRAVDDSDLDTFEVRYLLHIWRRGSCWESPRAIERLGIMSKSQAHRAKTSLIEKGWIVEVVEGRRVVQRLSGIIPGEESIVVNVPDRDSSVPTRDASVPVRDALPINRTKEDNQPKATSPLDELDAHFHGLTLVFPNGANYEDNWRKPLEAILLHAGSDVEKAKALITQAVAVARGDNNRGRVYPVSSPKSIANIAANLAAQQAAQSAGIDADALWLEALQVVRSGNVTGVDPQLVTAIRAVGWPVIQQSSEKAQDELKRRLMHEYRAAVSAAA